LNVHGLFNVYNALAASAVAYSLGMNVDEIKVALDSYRAFPMRFEVTRKEGVTIINDSYNANPSSMKESVRELVRLGGSGRVVAILGDMLELGEFTEDEHRDVGRMISDSGVDVLVTVGAMMGLAAEECIKRQREKKGPETHVFRDVHGAEKNITDILKKGDTVLIKGSRSMTMEKVMEGIVHAL
jgi:UDP-N-acetylmuramoyl-tripeptide--D-alanyl-D-alanine ligase